MTVFFLVRHGSHDRLGRFLDGRTSGVHLSQTGLHEAARLARRLSRERIDAVYASPLERAQATAAPIADALSLAVQVEPALNEIDFGDWSGSTFEAFEAEGRLGALEHCAFDGADTFRRHHASFADTLARLHRQAPA